MPFDPSTARPVGRRAAFDSSTARPAAGPWTKYGARPNTVPAPPPGFRVVDPATGLPVGQPAIPAPPPGFKMVDPSTGRPAFDPSTARPATGPWTKYGARPAAPQREPEFVDQVLGFA